MGIAVFTKKELDCVMKDCREYFFFNIEIALELVILRAIEMSLVTQTIVGEESPLLDLLRIAFKRGYCDGFLTKPSNNKQIG